MSPNDRAFRFLLLFFNCMLTFGSYYCFDMPSVMQEKFQTRRCNASEAVNSTTCCTDCLGMIPEHYNLLYAVYAWTNAVVVIGAGFLIDKVGNRVGVFLFSSLCVIGSCIFAAGVSFAGTAYLLPVMLVGRLVFGAGNGSLTIVQNRVTAYWFRNKELAMAFGITLALSRLGSVLNFLLTPSAVSAYGVQVTLWTGSALCGLGFLSAIVVSSMDVYGVKSLGQEANLKETSKNLRFSDLRHFSLQFWLLVITIMFFYNGIFPFVADASKFIQDKYGYKQSAAYIAGAVYDVSMILSPFLGGVIDVVGQRGMLAASCAVLTVPVFGILAFTDFHPLIATIWLGVTYSIAAASMWPSIPLVVRQCTIGTAMGLTTSIQMIGIGISNVVVGAILGVSKKSSSQESLTKWKCVMIFLLFNMIACIISATALNIVDKRRGAVLNMSRKEKMLRYPSHNQVNVNDSDSDSERDPLLLNRERNNQYSN